MVPLLTLLPLPVPRHHLQPRRCRSEVQLAQLFPSTEGGWLSRTAPVTEIRYWDEYPRDA